MQKYNSRRSTAVFVTCLVQVCLPHSRAAEQSHVDAPLEEIIVSAPFEQTAAETVTPVGVLSGEELREKVANSLGDTLKNEIGISSASFGSSVGHPVIRGHTGNRVSILQNGVGVTDASNQSPDHAEGVEALLADRLEVIRGPATLLYGSGAIGGIVNVIDERIPEQRRDEAQFFLEQSHNSGNDENKTVARFDGTAGAFGFHVDGFYRENNFVEIPGAAIDVAALEELEALAAPAQDAHDPGDEFENSRGFIGNSDAEAWGASLGASLIGEQGFLGFSVGVLDNDYGLPPGVHGHHEADSESEAETEAEVENVRISLEQLRYDLRGRLEFQQGWIEELEASVGLTDYNHREIEIFEDGTRETGTRFDNQGLEGRLTASHGRGGVLEGVWGAQFSATDFSAVGEEAFIPASDISGRGLFGLERLNGERATLELGLRLDRNAVDPVGRCETSEHTVSASGSLIFQLRPDSNLILGLSRSQRTPSVEELYSNVSAQTCQAFADSENLVLHAATGLFEIGNPQLGRESANNLELGVRRHRGDWRGEFSAYRNEISDYIFLDIGGLVSAEVPRATFAARDATFTGLEGKLSLDVASLLGLNRMELNLNIFGDLVEAEFENGDKVPRIPPAKFGAEIRLFGNHWSTHLHVTRALAQSDAAVLELATDAFTRLSLYGDYHWQRGNGSEIKVYARADNMLDEEIRNHASFLKLLAPEPGRSLVLGLRFDY